MKKKKQQEPSLHDLAVRLCEGGVVFFEGHSIKAKLAYEEVSCCEQCQMDSICNERIQDLCMECDFYDGHDHYLQLNI